MKNPDPIINHSARHHKTWRWLAQALIATRCRVFICDYRSILKKWLFKKYWTASSRDHIFTVKAKSAKGVEKLYQVVRTSAIGIKRHIKIKAAANPYLPEYAIYGWERRHKKERKELAAFSAREYRAMVAARG